MAFSTKKNTTQGKKKKASQNGLSVQLATDSPTGLYIRHLCNLMRSTNPGYFLPPQHGCLQDGTRYTNSTLIIRFSAWLHKPTKGENVNDSGRYSSCGSHEIFNILRVRKNPPGKIQSIFMLH